MTQHVTDQQVTDRDGAGSSDGLVERLRDQKQAYTPDREIPLSGYLVTMSAYGSAVGALIGAAVATGKRPPERIAPFDWVLVSLATHKLSRLITKDSITSPLRAPFTRFKGVSGPAELQEEVRHQGGVRHAVGELLTCPFCLGMWISTGFSAGSVFAPRFTRLAASTLAALAASDFLHFAYAKTYQNVE